MIPDDPEALQAQLLAIAEAVNAATVEQFYRAWEAWAHAILDAADLPPWSETLVFLDAHGRWERAHPPYQQSGRALIHLRGLIDRRHGFTSKERYAYDILDELYHLRMGRTSQKIDAVERAWHRLHGLIVEVTIKVNNWEADARFGRQVREERRTGGKNRPRPDPQELQHRDRQLQQEAERIKQQHRHLSKSAIAKLVAPVFGLKPNTARQKIHFPNDWPSSPTES